jgi:hypothetical protein
VLLIYTEKSGRSIIMIAERAVCMKNKKDSLFFEIWIFRNGQPHCDDDHLRLIKCSIIILSRVIFVHNSRFSDYLHLINPNELEVKVTTDTQKSASYLDLTLKSTTVEY